MVNPIVGHAEDVQAQGNSNWKVSQHAQQHRKPGSVWPVGYTIRVTIQSFVSNLLSTWLNVTHGGNTYVLMPVRAQDMVSTAWARGSGYGLTFTRSHVVRSVAIIISSAVPGPPTDELPPRGGAFTLCSLSDETEVEDPLFCWADWEGGAPLMSPLRIVPH